MWILYDQNDTLKESMYNGGQPFLIVFQIHELFSLGFPASTSCCLLFCLQLALVNQLVGYFTDLFNSLNTVVIIVRVEMHVKLYKQCQNKATTLKKRNGFKPLNFSLRNMEILFILFLTTRIVLQQHTWKSPCKIKHPPSQWLNIRKEKRKETTKLQ